MPEERVEFNAPKWLILRFETLITDVYYFIDTSIHIFTSEAEHMML